MQIIEDEERHEQAFILERVTLFNDAVFAIVLTLLVLEIRMPKLTDFNSAHEMMWQLWVILPKFFAFALSAMLVGSNWISSIQVQRLVAKSTPIYIITLVLYLTNISLMPFTCSLIGEYPGNPVSFVVFGAVSGLLVITASLFIGNCLRQGLFHPNTDFIEVRKLMRRMPFIFLFIMAMAGSAFISTKLSFTLFLLWNALPFFLTRRLRVVRGKG